MDFFSAFKRKTDEMTKDVEDLKITDPKPKKEKWRHGTEVILTKGVYKGYNGTVDDFSSGKYIVELQNVPGTLTLENNQVKRDSPDSKDFTLIKSKKFTKGMRGTIIEWLPPSLSIYVDALNRKITTHLVCENCENDNETPRYVHRKIHPDDLFYKDIILKNGNYFQVYGVSSWVDMKFFGVEYGETSPKEITRDEIDSFNKEFREPKKVEQSDAQLKQSLGREYVPSEEEGTSLVEERDDVSDSGELDYEEPELNENENQEGEMVSTFRDIERTMYSDYALTPEQKQIKQLFTKVFNAYNINEINVYDLVNELQDYSDKLSKYAKVKYESDNKYLVAVLALIEIHQLGYISIVSHNEYIDTLIDSKFFNKKDFPKTSFLVKGAFDIDEQVVKSLVKSKLNEGVKYAFERALEFIGKYKNVEMEYGNTKSVELIDVGKEKRVEKIKFVRPSDLVKYYEEMNLDKDGDKILLEESDVKVKQVGKNYLSKTLSKPDNEQLNPYDIISKDLWTYTVSTGSKSNRRKREKEVKIIWGPEYEPILDKFRNILNNKINNSKKETEKEIYTFILENIHRAPAAIAELRSELRLKHSKKLLVKLDLFEQIFGHLLDDIQKQYVSELETSTNIKRLTIEMYTSTGDERREKESDLQLEKTSRKMKKIKMN